MLMLPFSLQLRRIEQKLDDEAKAAALRYEAQKALLEQLLKSIGEDDGSDPVGQQAVDAEAAFLKENLDAVEGDIEAQK